MADTRRIQRYSATVSENFEDAGTLDPWGGYYFSLIIDDEEVATFMELSGMKTTAEVFEIQEGGFNGHVHKKSARSKWDNLVLKYATSVSTKLLEWRDKYLTDDFSGLKTTSGSIVMYSNDGEQLRTYNFVNAWPVGWEGPTLNAGGSELAMETLEIAHEGIYIDSLPPPPPERPPTPPPPARLDVPPVQFELDSDQLTSEGDAAVAVAADQVLEYEIEDLWIEGHTCTMGTWSHNKSLSDRRANTVLKELKKKVKAEKPNLRTNYQSLGFSYNHPVSSNATQAGREANRRSEFMTTSWDDRAPSAGCPASENGGLSASKLTPRNKKYESPWDHPQ